MLCKKYSFKTRSSSSRFHKVLIESSKELILMLQSMGRSPTPNDKEFMNMKLPCCSKDWSWIACIKSKWTPPMQPFLMLDLLPILRSSLIHSTSQLIRMIIEFHLILIRKRYPVISSTSISLQKRKGSSGLECKEKVGREAKEMKPPIRTLTLTSTLSRRFMSKSAPWMPRLTLKNHCSKKWAALLSKSYACKWKKATHKLQRISQKFSTKSRRRSGCSKSKKAPSAEKLHCSWAVKPLRTTCNCWMTTYFPL